MEKYSSLIEKKLSFSIEYYGFTLMDVYWDEIRKSMFYYPASQTAREFVVEGRKLEDPCESCVQRMKCAINDIEPTSVKCSPAWEVPHEAR